MPFIYSPLVTDTYEHLKEVPGVAGRFGMTVNPVAHYCHNGVRWVLSPFSPFTATPQEPPMPTPHPITPGDIWTAKINGGLGATARIVAVDGGQIIYMLNVDGMDMVDYANLPEDQFRRAYSPPKPLPLVFNGMLCGTNLGSRRTEVTFACPEEIWSALQNGWYNKALRVTLEAI